MYMIRVHFRGKRSVTLLLAAGTIKVKRTEQDAYSMPRWDSLAKQRQAELCRLTRPWTRSTGPVTPFGKQVASRNAVKKKQPLSQQLHSAFTLSQESGIDRPLRVGDRVTYVGSYQPTFDVCQGLPLEVVGFDEAVGAICASQQRFAIACRTSAGQLIWIYRQDLQRCPDGQRKHESGNQS
jgi:hypothetical protein